MRHDPDRTDLEPRKLRTFFTFCRDVCKVSLRALWGVVLTVLVSLLLINVLGFLVVGFGPRGGPDWRVRHSSTPEALVEVAVDDLRATLDPFDPFVHNEAHAAIAAAGWLSWRCSGGWAVTFEGSDAATILSEPGSRVTLNAGEVALSGNVHTNTVSALFPDSHTLEVLLDGSVRNVPLEISGDDGRVLVTGSVSVSPGLYGGVWKYALVAPSMLRESIRTRFDEARTGVCPTEPLGDNNQPEEHQ